MDSTDVFFSCFHQDMVADIAMKWTKVLKTGGIGARLMGIDLGTILFTIERGQDTTEVCFTSLNTNG